MLVVDYPRPSPGLVVSERGLRVLEFLEACGGAPEAALDVLYRDAPKRLRALQGGGWAYRARLDGRTLWLPRSAAAPRTETEFLRQEAIGWLAVRLAEAGGAYAAGAASFPSRQVFPVAVMPPDKPREVAVLAVLLDGAGPDGLPAGSLYVSAQDLEKVKLEKCLKRVYLYSQGRDFHDHF